MCKTKFTQANDNELFTVHEIYSLQMTLFKMVIVLLLLAQVFKENPWQRQKETNISIKYKALAVVNTSPVDIDVFKMNWSEKKAKQRYFWLKEKQSKIKHIYY